MNLVVSYTFPGDFSILIESIKVLDNLFQDIFSVVIKMRFGDAYCASQSI